MRNTFSILPSTKILYIFGLLLLFCLILASYLLGRKAGFENGTIQGYTKGQFDFATKIEAELGCYINEKSFDENYSIFMEIKDVTIYTKKYKKYKILCFWRHVPSKLGKQ